MFNLCVNVFYFYGKTMGFCYSFMVNLDFGMRKNNKGPRLRHKTLLAKVIMLSPRTKKIKSCRVGKERSTKALFKCGQFLFDVKLIQVHLAYVSRDSNTECSEG